MKNLKTVLFIVIASSVIISCTPTKQLIVEKQKTISFALDNQEDGTNGSAIAFHPGKKLYYAVIAGNSEFPLEIFNSSGDFVLSTQAGVDCRGLWYNTTSKCLEANSYMNGVFKIKLADDGVPSGEIEEFISGNTVPSENACAEYDFKNNHLLYYHAGVLYKYNYADGSLVKEMGLDLPSSEYEINSTSFIYTGYKGLEIGLLNCQKNEIYFFDIKDGKFTETLKLPSGISPSCSFKFDFANDYAFFYDVTTRTWTGMKIF
ncbi:MAG TPA: hypothetical protein PLM49_05160 [Bacteroidales bacterium]|nr:hypothetical protein [Bacteroidales bacterium]